MMRSLQSRLSIGLLLSLVVAFALLALLVSFSIRNVTDDYVASRLQHDTETLLSAIRFDPQGKLVIDPQRIDQVYNQPFSGHYYVISSEQQTYYSRSLWDHQLAHAMLDSGQQQRAIKPGPEQQSLLVLSSGYTLQGRVLSISLAEDLKPIRQDIERLLYLFVLIAAAILLMLVVIQVLILRYSLTPLQRIHNELGELEQGKIDRLTTDVPRELAPLINEVNHLLGVMRQRLQRSRDGLSDLAHAIKKPLTVIKQQLNQNQMPASTHDVLTKQTDDIISLSERILKRARLAGQSHSGKRFSFEQDLDALIDTLKMMYPHRQIQLECRIEANINCPLDREDMLELLGNLLDNAYKWARHKINLRVSANEQLHITLQDDGPGIAADDIQALSRRGARLDESVEGHGFGLAIVQDTVSEYQGKMAFSTSTALGGLRVDIQLPISAS